MNYNITTTSGGELTNVSLDDICSILCNILNDGKEVEEKVIISTNYHQ
jgi:hypothetical protein